MTTKKRLLKNTTINAIGYAYLIVAAFIAVPILLRSLGQGLFGVFALLTTIPALAGSLDLGLGQATIRALSLTRSSQEKAKIARTSFTLFIAIGMTIALFVFLTLTLFRTHPFFYGISPQSMSVTTFILALTIISDYAMNHATTIPQSLQRFEIYNIRTFIVGSNGLVAALVSQLTGSFGVIFAARLATSLLTLVILMRFATRLLKSEAVYTLQLDRSEARSLLTFGMKNFIGKAANQVQTHFSKYALASMLSAAAVAIYTIPVTIVQRLAGALTQLATAFFPYSADLAGKKRIPELRRTYRQVQWFLVTVGIAQYALFRSFAEPILAWWLKDALLAAQITPILHVLSLAFIPLALTPIPSMLLDSLNKPHYTSASAVATTAIEIGLILVLTPSMKELGPAYAMLIALIVTTPLLLMATSRVMKSQDTVQ